MTPSSSLVRPTMCDKSLTLDKKFVQRKFNSQSSKITKLLFPIMLLQGTGHSIFYDIKRKRTIVVYVSGQLYNREVDCYVTRLGTTYLPETKRKRPTVDNIYSNINYLDRSDEDST
jgi:hypothetical protein